MSKASPPQRVETFWIDVNDHMPDDQVSVMIFDGEDISIGYHEEELWWTDSGKDIKVTHWADLPDYPK